MGNEYDDVHKLIAKLPACDIDPVKAHEELKVILYDIVNLCEIAGTTALQADAEARRAF